MSADDSLAIKIGSYVSIGLGPLLSQTVPMATDLRPWALWFSAIVSAVALAWFSVRLSKSTDRRVAIRDLAICCASVIVFALLHVAINLFWTVEHGGYIDTLWQVALVATFGLSVGSVTGALTAWDKSKKP